MKRFQNATLEYNATKRELVIKDAETNKIFFAIEFSEHQEIKRIFSLYPLSAEIKNKSLELKFSVTDRTSQQNLLTLIIDTNNLNSDRRTIISIAEEDLSNIIFS